MLISAIAAPIAALLTLASSAPTNQTLPDDTNIFDLEIVDKRKSKHHWGPSVAKVQLYELDNHGQCVQDKKLKRGKAMKAYSGKCLKLTADSDEFVRQFTYVPSDKLQKVRQGAEHEEEWVQREQSCEVRAFESEDCSSGEVEQSHVPGDKFWEHATTKKATKKHWKPGMEGWHFNCISAPMVRSVRLDCPDVNWNLEKKKDRDADKGDIGGHHGWFGGGH